MGKGMNVNKKRKNIGSYILMVIFILIGVTCGVLSIKILDLNSSGTNIISGLFELIYLLILIYIAIFIQIIVHEFGHFVFGKLSNYKFASFRIGNIMLINDNGKIVRKKFSIAGTGGQCLMIPSSLDCYDYPFLLYNLGGWIANIVFSVLCIVLYFIFKEVSFFSLLFILCFFMGVGIAIVNGIPMIIGGIANDGYNAMIMRKNKEVRRAFWLQLKINGLLTNGLRLKDMPKEYFEMPENADMSNPIICSIGVFRCQYLHDKHQFNDAKELSEYLIYNASGLLEIYKNELKCELMFYEIIDKCRKEIIEKIYTKELKKYIKATASYVSRKRLMYAYELLVNKNEQEAQKRLVEFEKVAKTYPYSVEVDGEREVIDFIKKKYCEISI